MAHRITVALAKGNPHRPENPCFDKKLQDTPQRGLQTLVLRKCGAKLIHIFEIPNGST